MKNRSSKQKNITTILFIVLIIVLLIGFLLFPRKYYYLDGGTVGYRGFMFIYSVENRNRLVYVDGNDYYERGNVISVFGIEIYSDATIDFEAPALKPHTSEAEEVNEKIDEVFETYVAFSLGTSTTICK